MINRIKYLYKNEPYSVIWITLIFFLGIFGKLICNENPIYQNGKSPLISSLLFDLKLTNYDTAQLVNFKNAHETAIFTFIPYSSTTLDSENSNFVSPFGQQQIKKIRFRHWLGTDDLGRDILAGIINGCFSAIIVGLFSVFIAFIIGLCFGITAGYYANTLYKLNIIQLIIITISIGLTYWLLFIVPVSIGKLFIILIFLTNYFLLTLLSKIKISKFSIPIDIIIMRLVEILKSIPTLLLIIVLCGLIANNSYWIIIGIIAFVSWGQFARISRADTFKVKNLDYITYAKQNGMSNIRIIYKHVLPNVLANSIALMVLAIPSAIIAESVLSFLGIGFPPEHVSWGTLLAQAKNNISAWWLFVFPTLFLLFTTLSINKIGQRLFLVSRTL
jgi:peptide/nickel transport system permease protein